MQVKKAHLLFEQSGTFKNEFLKLGIPAIDYDILDDFGETDKQVDLFKEISDAYEGKDSIFDEINPEEDVIFSFFPCVRFEDQIILALRGDSYSFANWEEDRKIENAMKIHHDLAFMYEMFAKMCLVFLRGGYRAVIENPYSEQHYLRRYFPLRPTIIDSDRSLNGDYYKKPTQYWFINCSPAGNILFEPLEYVERRTIKHETSEGKHSRKVRRSLIHPQYARRFILNNILDEEYIEHANSMDGSYQR